MIVIYHNNCFDGFTAAWIAANAEPQCRLMPANYGQPIPEVEAGEKVLMVDISFPRAEMERFAQTHDLTVLDHHKTAQEALKGFPKTTFDMNKSGARLAWEHFHPDTPATNLVRYVEDRDLWRFALPESREVNAYIQSYPRVLLRWSWLSQRLSHSLPECVLEGGAIMRSEETRVAQMIEQVQWKVISGYLVPVVNASVLFSEVGNELCKKFPTANFAAYYFDRGDGVRQWGLRSVGEFDVSEIAKQHGGGGHRNAAGYQENL